MSEFMMLDCGLMHYVEAFKPSPMRFTYVPIAVGIMHDEWYGTSRVQKRMVDTAELFQKVANSDESNPVLFRT